MSSDSLDFALDCLVSTCNFEIFGLSGFLNEKIFPIEIGTKMALPYRGPSQPLGTMNWIKLILHYVWKLSCTSVFLVLWFMRRKYSNDPSYFCTFMLNPPMKSIWPFIWKNLNSLNARIDFKFARCFILKDSFQYTHGKIFPPIVAPSNLLEPYFSQAWLCRVRKLSGKSAVSGSFQVNLLCQEAFR
jgi:hypothetical protein